MLVVVYLNGLAPADNIATVNGGKDTVGPNSVRVGSNQYVGRNSTIPPLVAGHTKPLTTGGATNQKTNVITIAIVDTNDDSVDSFVFIREKVAQMRYASSNCCTYF
jgi:hypothetical protein